MTLIISLINKSHIWQSADNRISINGQFHNDDSIKHISIRTPDGSALVAFTGVAELDSVKTIDWIKEVLRSETRTLMDSFNLLSSKLSQEMKAQSKPGPLLLSMAIFSGGRAFYGEITNIKKDIRAISSDFKTTIMEVDRSMFFVGGSGAKYITKNDIDNLLSLAEIEKKTDEVHEFLANLNKKVAKSCSETVSESCITVDMPASGEPISSKMHEMGGFQEHPVLFLGIDLTEITKALNTRMNDKHNKSSEHWDHVFQEAADRAIKPRKKSDPLLSG